MRDERELWDFPVKDGVSFPNANRVHPLMQERVERILLAAHSEEKYMKRAAYSHEGFYGDR